MSWIAVATIGAGALGAGASIYGANKAADAAPQQGYDVVELPQYSWTEPNLRMTGDFLSDSLQRLGRGEAPAYWDNAVPELRAGMVDPLRKQYYGREGERSGLIQQAQSAGAMGGLGPKAMMAQVSKRMKDYSEAEQQIDRYLTEQRVNMMNRQSEFLPQMMANMPQGPETAIVNYMGGVSQGGGGGGAGWAQAGGALSQMGGTLGQMYGSGMIGSPSTNPNTFGYITPGMTSGYGTNAPMGTFNTGSQSMLPSNYFG